MRVLKHGQQSSQSAVGCLTGSQKSLQMILVHRGAAVVNWTSALEYALAQGHRRVHIQSGSLLLVNQVNCKWACRSPHLQRILSTLLVLKGEIEQRGGDVAIEHVHKRFNKHAAVPARHSAQTRSSRSWCMGDVVDLV